MQGEKPISFKLKAVSVINNPTLTKRFEGALTRLREAGRSGQELRVARFALCPALFTCHFPISAFHGSHGRNMAKIAENGLLRVGHAKNPSKKVDDGCALAVH